MENQKPQLDLERDTYTKDQAAKRLGISYVTLHNRLYKTGKLRTVRVGRRVLIPKTELERYLSGANQ